MLPDSVRDTVVDAFKAPVQKPRWQMAFIGLCMAFVIAILLAIACSMSGCSSTQKQPTTPSAFVVEMRKLGHEVAVTYCAVHRVATPLVIAAEGAWPQIRMVRTIADAFCASVAAADRPLGYVVRPDGFEVIERPLTE